MSPSGRKDSDTNDPVSVAVRTDCLERNLMTDSAPSYEHPGITDPVSNERPRGTGPFATPVHAAKQPSAGSQTEVVDLAKELTEAGIKDALTDLADKPVAL